MRSAGVAGLGALEAVGVGGGVTADGPGPPHAAASTTAEASPTAQPRMATDTRPRAGGCGCPGPLASGPPWRAPSIQFADASSLPCGSPAARGGAPRRLAGAVCDGADRGGRRLRLALARRPPALRPARGQPAGRGRCGPRSPRCRGRPSGSSSARWSRRRASTPRRCSPSMAATVDAISGGRLILGSAPAGTSASTRPSGSRTTTGSRASRRLHDHPRAAARRRVDFDGALLRRRATACSTPARRGRAARRCMLGSIGPRMLRHRRCRTSTRGTSGGATTATPPTGFAAGATRVDEAAAAAGRAPGEVAATAAVLVSLPGGTGG